MKPSVTTLLLAVMLAFGGLFLFQLHKTNLAEGRAAGLQEKIAALEAGLGDRDQQLASLRDRLRSRLADASTGAAPPQPELANHAQPAARDDTPANHLSANPLGEVSEMFKKPEMKELIHGQQRAVFSGMVDRNYAELVASLRLPPEQAGALKDLLVRKQLVDADTALSLMSGDTDPAKRADLSRQARSDKDLLDAQIRQLLGDPGFGQYQSYERTQPDRMALNTFADQLAGGPTALAADQQQQLLQAMIGERHGFKFSADFSDPAKISADPATYFNEDKMNQFFQEQDQLNQRYLVRAQSFLSPDQFSAFRNFLANQGAMQKASMQMAGRMLAPK